MNLVGGHLIAAVVGVAYAVYKAREAGTDIAARMERQFRLVDGSLDPA